MAVASRRWVFVHFTGRRTVTTKKTVELICEAVHWVDDVLKHTLFAFMWMFTYLNHIGLSVFVCVCFCVCGDIF